MDSTNRWKTIKPCKGRKELISAHFEKNRVRKQGACRQFANKVPRFNDLDEIVPDEK